MNLLKAGGGNAQMKLDYRTALDKTGTIDARPVHKNYGIGESARIISPGRPDHSVMLQRVVGVAEGRMPPIGTTTLDPQWVNLLVEWIRQVEKPKVQP